MLHGLRIHVLSGRRRVGLGRRRVTDKQYVGGKRNTMGAERGVHLLNLGSYP